MKHFEITFEWPNGDWTWIYVEAPDFHQALLLARASLPARVSRPQAEALIGAISRICERKARDRLIPPAEAKRWRAAAQALMEAEAVVNARQTPEARKLDQHMAEWSGQAQPIDPATLEQEHGRQGPPEPTAADPAA